MGAPAGSVLGGDDDESSLSMTRPPPHHVRLASSSPKDELEGIRRSSEEDIRCDR